VSSPTQHQSSPSLELVRCCLVVVVGVVIVVIIIISTTTTTAAAATTTTTVVLPPLLPPPPHIICVYDWNEPHLYFMCFTYLGAVHKARWSI
jgi:hypothetical protein